MPWLLWWIYLPHEFVWRGWVASWAKTPKDWMVLSSYWTAWQLPSWLVEPQWHLGWWANNGTLFAQQVVSTWLVGTVLFGIQTRFRSIALTALLVSILTVSETCHFDSGYSPLSQLAMDWLERLVGMLNYEWLANAMIRRASTHQGMQQHHRCILISATRTDHKR